MVSKLGRTPPRYSPNPMQVNEHKSFRLKIRNPSEGLLLFRYLMTKFYRCGQKWTCSQDEASFYLVGLYFEELRNPGFYSKHELDFLKVCSLARVVLARSQGELPEHLRQQEILLLRQRVLLNPRGFLGLELRFKGGFLRSTNRQLRRPCPEPRRIGVGYRDKGTAQNSATDASPGWQEVAVSRQNRNEIAFGLPSSSVVRWFDRVRVF